MPSKFYCHSCHVTSIDFRLHFKLTLTVRVLPSAELIECELIKFINKKRIYSTNSGSTYISVLWTSKITALKVGSTSTSSILVMVSENSCFATSVEEFSTLVYMLSSQGHTYFLWRRHRNIQFIRTCIVTRFFAKTSDYMGCWLTN